MTSRFWLGVRHCTPIAASVVPFAIVVALAAVEAGLSSLDTMGMSVVVFAGAAQLAALELARIDAPAALIIGAAVVVNLRFVLYSASMAGHLRDVPPRGRAAMAYLLTDQAFALSAQHSRDNAPRASRVAYFVGAALTLWVAWQVGTAVGLAVGAGVPPELSLDFAVALVFIGLAVPALDRAPAVAAAATSVGVYLLCAGFPYGAGLLPAAAAGIAVGGLSDRKASA